MSSTEQDIDTINTFLNAYLPDVVRAALKRRNIILALDRKESGWRIWTQPGIPEAPVNWTRINGKVYYNDDAPPVSTVPDSVREEHLRRKFKKEKADTSIAPVQALKCPECGASMYKEGVCPGCEEGKKGYRIRLLCGECDKTILL